MHSIIETLIEKINLLLIELEKQDLARKREIKEKLIEVLDLIKQELDDE